MMEDSDDKLSVWQLFLVALSVLAIALLAFQTFAKPTGDLANHLFFLDNILCAFFFGDFFWQLYRAKRRMNYLKWGWLDLLSSIPADPYFRLARIARLIRIFRVFRVARASKHLARALIKQKAKNTFTAVALGSVLLIFVSSIAILSVEPSLKPIDALWWAAFTLISGEYGEFYPDTAEGRLITALLMTAGVAVFGTFTATIASYFLEEDNKEDEERDSELMKKMIQISADVAEIKAQLKKDSAHVQDTKKSK